MKNLRILLLLLTVSISTFGQTPPGNWSLHWSDEFCGTNLNTDNWTIQTGNLGVNNELQTYAADRVTVGNGSLTLFGSWDWDNDRLESGRIHSQNKRTWDEGYTEARIMFEDWDWNGKDATFAAFWSMGESYNQWSNTSAHNVNGGAAWPSCGENDIMEMVPGHSAISTIHYNPSYDYNGDGDSDIQHWPDYWAHYTVSTITPDWTQWNTFGCEKTDTELRYYLNGNYYGSHYLDDTRKEFHQPFFYIINVAIGGNLAGNPPNAYDVYVKMNVDYVRYYKKADDWAITIKGNNNKYVSSNNGEVAITCDRDSVDAWEKFEVVNLSDGRVALRGSNGKYVSSENGTKAMTCNRSAVDEWEKFTWVDLGNCQFALRGSNGKYVSSEDGTTEMMCNRSSIQDWEKFWYSETSLKSAPGEGNTETMPIETLEDFNVYPLPADNRIYISGPETNYFIQIFDLQGKIIIDRTNLHGNEPIDVSHLLSGYYILKATNNTKVYTKKLLIK